LRRARLCFNGRQPGLPHQPRRKQSLVGRAQIRASCLRRACFGGATTDQLEENRSYAFRSAVLPPPEAADARRNEKRANTRRTSQSVSARGRKAPSWRQQPSMYRTDGNFDKRPKFF
jgi:hypothetical protein